MGLDVIYNGRGYGDVADRLLSSGMDPDALRPWQDKKGRTLVSVFNQRTGRKETMVVNAPSTLMRDQWKLFDDAVLRAARPQLRVWGDLQAADVQRA
jgi:hypothetical protein